MFNYGFELAVNFVQSVYLIGFFLAFLGGKYSRKRNIAICSLFIALNFTVLTYFTFNNPYVVMIDMLTVVILHEVYCLTCLKGELAIKIILPLVASLINTIISYIFCYGFIVGRIGFTVKLFQIFMCCACKPDNIRNFTAYVAYKSKSV